MIRNGNIFNIKDMNVDVPLGCFNVITGVSGSGKSSLMYEIIYRNLEARLEARFRTNETVNCREFKGTEYLGRAILIDQSPIGRTPRSNPVTYTGAWTHIRDLFAAEPEARARGWGAGQILVQPRRRALRGLRRQRRDRRRDAFPADGLRGLRHLQRQAIHEGDSGYQVQEEEHPRHIGNDSRGRLGIFRGHSRPSMTA